MRIENTIFLKNEWRWSKFQKYIIYKLKQYDLQEYVIPSEYSFRETTYGSRKKNKDVILFTWAGKNKRINFCRSVCINSSSYCVLNFLIIPNTKYNVPFFGICHGAQYVANYFGSKITKIKNHTKKDHVILFKNEFKNIKVNSYHNYGIIKLGKQLNMIAFTKDSSIEAFKHNNKQILGIMWHPERYKKIRKFDIQFLKKYL